jgi:hypothetical protein
LSPWAAVAQDERVNLSVEMPKLLCLLALTLLLSGCGMAVPAANSGAVETYRNGQMTSLRQLTRDEARAFSSWFQTHSGRWNRTYTADSPATLIRLKHSNSETTVINFLGATAVVRNSSGQFRKLLSIDEEAELRKLVEGPASGNRTAPRP